MPTYEWITKLSFVLGADITDYFNYGFTEDTWQAYCSRQRRMRVNESGAGLPAGPGGSSHHYNRTSQLNSSAQSNGKISTSNLCKLAGSSVWLLFSPPFWAQVRFFCFKYAIRGKYKQFTLTFHF